MTISMKPSGFWTVPQGVTKIHAVAIGGGGGGGGLYTSNRNARSAGGGGGLSCTDLYSNVGIDVIPGESLEVNFGYGGIRGIGGLLGSNPDGNGKDGGDSYIKRGSTYLLLAKGGSGGSKLTRDEGFQPGGQSSAGVGDIKFSGGYGGSAQASITTTGTDSSGGGGAAGFLGNGGDGWQDNGIPSPYDYRSEGGNGGYSSQGGGGASHIYAGGDVNLYNAPSPRNYGASRYTYSIYDILSFGTNGETGSDVLYSNGTLLLPPRAGNGGLFGGGGGAGKLGSDNITYGDGGYGGIGCVRIIWGPSRIIPDSFIDDAY